MIRYRGIGGEGNEVAKFQRYGIPAPEKENKVERTTGDYGRDHPEGGVDIPKGIGKPFFDAITRCLERAGE